MVEKSELGPGAHDWWSQIASPFQQFGQRVAEFFAPSTEAAATKEAYEITIELPGVSDEDINIEVHDNRLTVSGEKRSSREDKGRDYFFSERTYGRFQRIFRLPADADIQGINATHKDGVLTIQVPKKVAKPTDVHRINVTRL